MPNQRKPWTLTLWLVLSCGALTWAALTWLMHFDRLEPTPHALMPQPVLRDGRLMLKVPGYSLSAHVMTYRDELFAYLMFDFLRHNPAFKGGKLLLTFNPRRADAPYRLVYRAHDDLLSAYGVVEALSRSNTIQPHSTELVPEIRIGGYEQQTQLFDAAYNLPVRKKLEQLPERTVAAYLRRFIRFKSMTDPRIRRKLEPVPSPLSTVEAQQMAADIIQVSQFFGLPLEFFTGIAAVENNYMNVRGDLQHSVWKRRPAADDVVLERKRGRVRVLNDSAGVWQITRETLRYAHSLIRNDQRDYSSLPEHLRPPETLDVQQVSPQVLTTYAGILLRDLLERFDGDVKLAVSAYNGGPARPNLRYGDFVLSAAAHARRVVEQAAVLNGETVVGMTWLRRP